MENKMEFLHTNNAPKAIGPYSQAIRANGMIYTSGQIALTKDGIMLEDDIKIQTVQVFKNLKAVLQDNQSDINKIVKINIFLTNMGDFDIVNKIMIDIFKDHKPARSTVCVKSLPKNALVEMDIIATI
jgi:2-iminobutanoate/2-iminopropanoate deaminase